MVMMDIDIDIEVYACRHWLVMAIVPVMGMVMVLAIIMLLITAG